jgi:hypothetical protein
MFSSVRNENGKKGTKQETLVKLATVKKSKTKEGERSARTKCRRKSWERKTSGKEIGD